MKNLKLLLLLVLPALFVFTGCEEDEDQDLSPSLEFLGGTFVDEDVTLEPGETFEVGLVANENPNSKTNLENFKITKTIVNTQEVLDSSISGSDFRFEGTLTASAVEATETFRFTVTDRDGETQEVSFIVTTEGPAVSLEDSVEGAFFHIGGSLRGSWDLVGDSSVASPSANPTQNDQFKDMQNTDAVSDPFTGSWESAGNGTLFVKPNTFDYDNATVQSAEVAFAAGNPGTVVNGPVAGDIYIAKLRETQKLAVIKVTNVDPNNNECGCNNPGKITFDYKK